MAEANDFKFGIELGFAKSNYIITPKDKSGEFTTKQLSGWNDVKPT